VVPGKDRWIFGAKGEEKAFFAKRGSAGRVKLRYEARVRHRAFEKTNPLPSSVTGAAVYGAKPIGSMDR